MPTYACAVCGEAFSLSEELLARFPGWTPRYCRKHKPGAGKSASASSAAKPSKAAGLGKAAGLSKAGGGGRGRSLREANLSVADTMASHSGGPDDGVFTDGSCDPNPGRGGWGFVWVAAGEAKEMQHGYEADTTNNRMELMAVIKALELLPDDANVPIYSDSQLVCKTLEEWAAGWKSRGWKRKAGPIANLDLVQQAFALYEAHPGVQMRWIAAHSGNRWNEVADSLATAWMRDKV